SGYAAAAQALAGYAGHGGQPLQQESGVHLADGERGMLLTSFTDYQDALETEHAGAKAVLGPTLQAEAQTITATVAGAIRELL
ncbi:MAG TPA: hypothetical protein PKK15_22245, partial [Kouleothrix sp.]|nr:hypothetical protein [Kouleothrix sp.]